MIIPSNIMIEIRLDPFLKNMAGIVYAFDKYLQYTSTHVLSNRIMTYSYLDDEIDPVIDSLECIKEYENRWSVPWQNDTLRRLYNLHFYYVKYPKELPKYSCLIVLTGAHDSPDERNFRTKNSLGHMDYLEKHYQARKLFLQYLRKSIPNVGRMVMSEGHPKSGFIHDNILLFLNEKPSEETMKKLQKYWSDGLKMGSIDRAMTYKFREVKDFKEILSLVNYPMKYLNKNMWLTIKEWTKYDWVYNASIYWARKEKIYGGLGHVVRTFQPDNKLSKIMKYQYLPDIPEKEYREGKNRFVDTRLHHLKGGGLEFYDELGNIHHEKIINRVEPSFICNTAVEIDDGVHCENYHDSLLDWYLYASPPASTAKKVRTLCNLG